VKASAKQLLELCTTFPQMHEPVEIAVRRKLPIDKKYAESAEPEESCSSDRKGAARGAHAENNPPIV